ncbi:hypothetical protein LRS11_07825 [Pseudomonas sp. J452]|uniref:hypothetical protein n=1 Tax=Pseudomonas sp. J452 TaxID=2898441 RepID=UPI0021AD684B|nr:hypothetical protein [Pseudomonas sp. J452]UUY09929.1 hypothetical protein LRS11_07825 [Pseudomonas sp. J452]
MDIRIVAIESQPPIWRVYLNSFFIVCHSAAEAEETAYKAAISLRKPFRQVLLSSARVEQAEDAAPFSVL